MRWSASGALPAAVRARLDLARGERVLAAAADDEGCWTVGTDRGLHVPDAEHWRLLLWERIDRASWNEERALLLVVEVADFGQAQPRHELSVRDPARLLGLVRDRVTASVLLTRHVPVQGSRGFKVVARRSPTGRGPVDWSCWLDDGLDPADPEVRRAVDEALAASRAELGL